MDHAENSAGGRLDNVTIVRRDGRRLPLVAQHYLVDIEGVDGGRSPRSLPPCTPVLSTPIGIRSHAQTRPDSFSGAASLRE